MADTTLAQPTVRVAAPPLSWPNALAALLLILWFIPIKSYRLPIDLPFNLEVYRLFLLVLCLGWVAWIMGGEGRVGAGGHGKPLVLLLGTAILAAAANFGTLNAVDDSQALKSLSYFLGFLLTFTLITSTISSFADIEKLGRVLVFGGAVVALFALFEAQTRVNYFDRLDRIVPFLVFEPREVDAVRAGRLRVRGSAQHPIALSCALVMTIPLAIHFAGHAASKLRSRLWLIAGTLAALGAFATVSRTSVVMFVLMGLTALILRGRRIARYWPLLILLPFVIHFVTPGALGGIRNSLFPKEGLASDLSGRAGLPGSGRLDDIDPGLRRWEQSPLYGHGLGSQGVTGSEPARVPVDPRALTEPVGVHIIFDNQYLHTLVELGILGIVGTIWFVWGAGLKLASTSRRLLDRRGDLIAACATSCIGFGASLLFFDAFAFVQATLVFFVVAALGLRARELAAEPGPA